MVRKKRPPPESEPQEIPSIDRGVIDFFSRHRLLIIGSGVVALVLVALIFWMVRHYNEKNEEAWIRLARLIGTAGTTAEFEAALEPRGDLEGTTAEPWGTYALCVQAFQNGEPEKARRLLEAYREEFGDHYIFDHPQLGPRLAGKIEAECEWRAKHPLETAPEEPADEPETDPTATPDGSTNPPGAAVPTESGEGA